MKRREFISLFAASAVCGICTAESAESKKEKLLQWFLDNEYGHAPIGRPADEVIGERSVTFANGTITIDIHVSLPEGASAEHPAPVFIFGDHCGAKEKTPPFTKYDYDGIPTNTITSRGYAYVRWNFNDVCPNAARVRAAPPNHVHPAASASTTTIPESFFMPLV